MPNGTPNEPHEHQKTTTKRPNRATHRELTDCFVFLFLLTLSFICCLPHHNIFCYFAGLLHIPLPPAHGSGPRIYSHAPSACHSHIRTFSYVLTRVFLLTIVVFQIFSTTLTQDHPCNAWWRLTTYLHDLFCDVAHTLCSSLSTYVLTNISYVFTHSSPHT